MFRRFSAHNRRFFNDKVEYFFYLGSKHSGPFRKHSSVIMNTGRFGKIIFLPVQTLENFQKLLNLIIGLWIYKKSTKMSRYELFSFTFRCPGYKFHTWLMKIQFESYVIK